MRVEFRGYGANIIIAPAGDAQHAASARRVAEPSALGAVAAPFLYTVGSLRGEPVVVAGVDFRRAAPLTDTGAWVPRRRPGECLAGTTAWPRTSTSRRARRRSSIGAPRRARHRQHGRAEDAQIVIPFAGEAASLIQVRADGARLDAIHAALAQALPDADVRLLHAVAETEANVVLKVRSSLYLLTGLILAITTLCVSSNFSALVIERSQEIGMLKAIGAAERKIAALFLSESLMLGTAFRDRGLPAGPAGGVVDRAPHFPGIGGRGRGGFSRVPAGGRRHAGGRRRRPRSPRRPASGGSSPPSSCAESETMASFVELENVTKTYTAPGRRR